MISNKEKVKEYLLSGKTLTAMDGFRLFNIVSVRDYVSMLRRDGISIQSEWRENLSTGKRFKEYFI